MILPLLNVMLILYNSVLSLIYSVSDKYCFKISILYKYEFIKTQMIADFCELDCCIIFESNIPFAKICVQRFNNTLANNHLYCDVLLIEKRGTIPFTE